MLKKLVNRIPEKYRIHAFLVITSIAGVFLILVAVYNASNELELIHEIENTHKFALALSQDADNRVSSYQNLLSISDENFHVLIMRNNEAVTETLHNSKHIRNFNLSDLEQSRLNDKGGHVEIDKQLYTWTMLPVASNGAQALILQNFSYSGLDALAQVYTKRLLVPALFYVWLMVWVGYILRFLTHKLSMQKCKMEHMALHDTLTGLPNRNLLNDRLDNLLEIAKRDGTSFTVVMIDLDGFKRVNDTYGHATGDDLLKEIATRLKDCLRPHDTVCRVGGDEFILLLNDMHNNSRLEVCKRISEEISKPVIIQDEKLRVGSSIGLAQYSDNSESADLLIHKADQAMYEIKSKGGGILIYDDSISTSHKTSTTLSDVVQNQKTRLINS